MNTTVLTCPHGHRWPVPDTAREPGSTLLVCPVCGSAAELPEVISTGAAADGSPSGWPTLPGYEVMDELGQGGMGVVYRALDVKRQAEVALKTLPWVEPAALYQFKQEFRTLAGLAHPNLVTLYELVSDGRQWFFTMELIDGVDFLRHVRAGGTDPAGRLREALRQLAAGVHALHEAGKLHRDIKPGNVLVTRRGRVVLLDFGLAAELDRAGLHRDTAPRVMGTVFYMAPEQAAGQPLSRASDWYAVGALLYEAITGRVPFDGQPLEVLMRKQQVDPPPPRALAPGVPKDLDTLAVELLRRDPQARPSGPEVLRRLGGPAAAPPTSPPAAALVGRRRELDALADAFGASRQGRSVVVRVHGRSGVGKSALVQSFLEDLSGRDQAVTLSGRCYEQEAVPYKALDSLVDALSRYLVRLREAEAAAVLPRDVAVLTRVFPVLRRVEAVARAPHRPVDLSDPREVRRRAVAALRELLARLGDRRPVVLFIDDLQWGDVDSAALLADLLQPPDPPALLLLVAYRSEDAGAPCLSALWHALGDDGAGLDRRELAVEPLTFEEGRDLVRTLLDPTRPGAEGDAEAIARESGGNPFFLHELVQHVRQGGPGGAGTADAAPAHHLTLHEVLWNRIVRLPDAARRLLEVVAVAGQPLPQDQACQAAGLDGDDLAALPVLRAGRFVRGTGATEPQAIEAYHDRIRETVVAHLAAPELREYHCALARVLETSGEADPELLANHLQGAGESARAAASYEQAAARASDALAFDRAARLYRLALDLKGADGPDERGLRTHLADALANAGRGAESAREYLAAAAGAAPAEALELRRRAALQLLASGHVADGLAALRAVLGAVGMAMPPTPRRAFWALVWRRLQLRLRGLRFRQRPAARVAPEALSRINICWSASAGLSMVDTVQGAYFQTRGLLLALAAGEPYALARALALEAAHTSIGGSRSRARTTRLLEAADELTRQVDHPYPRGMVAMARGIAAAFEGRWRPALALADEAEATFRGSCTGVMWELDTAQRFALWALMYQGEIAELSRRLPVLWKEAEDRDDLYAVTNLALIVGTFARLAADDPDGARREIAHVMTRWSREGFDVQHLEQLHDEAGIALYRGDGGAAWERLQGGWGALEASHFFRVQQVRIFMRHARARAALAAAPGATDRTAMLRTAEADARRIRGEAVPWGEALARLLFAGVAIARGAGDGARLLRDAAAALDAVDMALHAASARRLLGLVVGGDDGRALVAAADGWMRGQGIKNPARLAAMLVPGLTGAISTTDNTDQKHLPHPRGPASAG
jgi:hypothetical protein